MLTLCAEDCALSITYNVIACQFSTVNMGRGRSGRNVAHDVLVTTYVVNLPALQSLGDYVARVESHKDTVMASLNVLES
jgi:hypothetical protein